MKLNKYDKQAFVSSVMDDVPKIDYNSQAKKIMQDAATYAAPKLVQEAFAKHPEYFAASVIAYAPDYLENCYLKLTGFSGYVIRDKHPEAWAKLLDLSDLAKAQSEKHKALEAQVTAAIAACSTLKQAKERLPEFEKYLPDDRDSTGVCNLPATIANVVSQLTEAGWPKGAVTA